jgi:hypothetical protein
MTTSTGLSTSVHAGNAHRVRTPGACLEKSPAQATGLTASGDRRATIVPAGAEHQFAGYEGLAVLVIFKRSGKARRTSEG